MVQTPGQWPPQAGASPPARQSRVGLWIALSAVALVVVIGAGAAVGVVLGQPATDPGGTAPTKAVAGGAPATVQITDSELAALASARSTALADGSLPEFLAPLDQGNRKLITAQTQLFANLKKLAFSEWHYSTLEQQGRSVDRFGRGVTITLDVAFVHRIKDFDAHPVAEWYRWTVTKKDAGSKPVITGITGTPKKFSTQSKTEFYPAPWDAWPDMQVVRTPHTLFLVDRPMVATTRRYAPIAERAAVDILGTWRSGGKQGPIFDRFVTSLVPDTKQLGSIYQIAVDEVWEAGHSMPMPKFGAETGDNSSGATRVVIDTSSGYFRTSDTQAAGEIFRHEFTHSMLQGINRGDNPDALVFAPVWVYEGIAEYVEDKHSETPMSRSGSADQLIRAGRFSGKLPGVIGWGGGDAAATNLDYYLAHQVYRYIARKYGEPKVYAFAAAYYTGGATLEEIFRTVLGVDQATFERQWAAFVRAEAR